MWEDEEEEEEGAFIWMEGVVPGEDTAAHEWTKRLKREL